MTNPQSTHTDNDYSDLAPNSSQRSNTDNSNFHHAKRELVPFFIAIEGSITALGTKFICAVESATVEKLKFSDSEIQKYIKFGLKRRLNRNMSFSLGETRSISEHKIAYDSIKILKMGFSIYEF